jgi:hypothetical protein
VRDLDLAEHRLTLRLNEVWQYQWPDRNQQER